MLDWETSRSRACPVVKTQGLAGLGNSASDFRCSHELLQVRQDLPHARLHPSLERRAVRLPVALRRALDLLPEPDAAGGDSNQPGADDVEVASMVESVTSRTSGILARARAASLVTSAATMWTLAGGTRGFGLS